MTRPRDPRSIVAEARFRTRLGELGAELLEPWRGANLTHRIRCAAGHESTIARPSYVNSGGGVCRVCGNGSAAAEAAFRATLAELGAELLEPWRGACLTHWIRCAAGHEGTVHPASVRRGGAVCRVCNRPGAALTAAAEARFRARLAELGAELLEPWRGAQLTHWIRCAAGHESTPQPTSVNRGGGVCRACGNGSAAAEAAFRATLAELGAELLEPRWRGSLYAHRVRCAAGHESTIQPTSVQHGNGVCRVCSGKVWDVFYVVTAPDTGRVKFGITSGDPRARLRVHRAAGYREVSRLLVRLPDAVAHEIERAALAALVRAEVRPVKGREYYDASALPLVLDVADNYPIGVTLSGE